MTVPRLRRAACAVEIISPGTPPAHRDIAVFVRGRAAQDGDVERSA